MGGTAGYLVGSDEAQASDGTGSVPFYGEHQAGIDTPAQELPVRLLLPQGA